MNPRSALRAWLLATSAFAAAPSLAATPFDLASYPLFFTLPVHPNVLVVLDNSQSMDATMAGKMLSGNDPATRSNAARSVLRKVITDHRHDFNWGLGTFAISGAPTLWQIYGQYLGNASTMLYTNTCDTIVDGVGVSDKAGPNGPLPCIGNPEQGKNGYAYVTFGRSGDDADVNDVYYYGYFGPQGYGVGAGGTNYYMYQHRAGGTGWSPSDFTDCFGGGGPCYAYSFNTTDAGFVPDADQFPRQLFIWRGWGYSNDPTGRGQIAEDVVTSQTTNQAEVDAEEVHHSRLLSLLGSEDNAPASPSIKNAATYTPLAGTLETSRRYFEGNGYASPIVGSCQKNFVVLATDGNPTGRKDGFQYDPSQWVNTYDPVAGTWTYGPAINDVLAEITALRRTSKSGIEYDVRTYVVGLGDTLANPNSIATLNEMANKGGTNRAHLANNTAALTTAFQSIVTDIGKESSAASSVAVSAGSWRTGAAIYQATFSTVINQSGRLDWSGRLVALPVLADGSLGASPTWDAASRLNAQAWDSGRAILTYKPSAAPGSRGIALRWPADPAAPTAAELDASQVTALNTNPDDGTVDGFGAQRLAWLRGNTANETRNCAACTPQFRDRATSVLGDIVDSAPIYVGPPSAGYDDALESASYSAFAAAHRSRPPYLYVGANDGMLHAFDAATGDEKFAYVPGLVFPLLSQLTSTFYAHRYSVDGSPMVGDAFYNGAWHTLLVAGLGAGAPGLYALDVTDPATIAESGAAAAVRWEFSDPDMGHVFARPLDDRRSAPALVKTHNGRWSVIVGNGVNATGSPRAQLFVIDAETGALVRKIDTGAGSAASPNGLAAAAPVDLDDDGIVDVAYAGDLDGNLWKFDLSAPSPASWSVAVGGVPLFQAGATKPITTMPNVTPHPREGVIVVFATGRYLASGDLSSIATQTAYGIWDKGDNAQVTETQLQQQVFAPGTATGADGNAYRFSTHRVGVPLDNLLAQDLPTTTRANYFANLRGWALNLPDSGERVVSDPVIRGGRAIFTSVVPAQGRCDAGGTGWISEVDVVTGNRLATATFNTNTDAILSTADFLTLGGQAAPNNTTSWSIGGVPAGPSFMNLGEDKEVKFVNTSLGSQPLRKLESAGSVSSRRVMWRVAQ